jgi:DNA-directed RNA polymerase specialized sigma24 family protein
MSITAQTEISNRPDDVVPAGSGFAPTRWTLVARARGETPEARTALSELCGFYYEPVFEFLRREGRGDDAARELAHEFFARILAGSGFQGADHERGRFRSYLLGALKHFLADERAKARRLKRGGGLAPESLDAAETDEPGGGHQVADAAAVSPEAEFDRQWALAVMARSLEALRQEMIGKGKTEHFEAFKPWLAGDGSPVSQAHVAARLGLTEGAAKVVVHRLRKRFGELVRLEITQTLRDPAQANEELAHLIAALS